MDMSIDTKSYHYNFSNGHPYKLVIYEFLATKHIADKEFTYINRKQVRELENYILQRKDLFTDDSLQNDMYETIHTMWLLMQPKEVMIIKQF